MSRPGRPQGGAQSEAGKAAYWRMQYESAIGALADLIAEHTETVESITNLKTKVEERLVEAEQILDPHDAWLAMAYREVLRMIKEAQDG